MIDYSSGLPVAVRRQNEDMVRLVETASDRQYGAPCEDHSGTTVAEVAAHCAEGYEMTAVWLRRLTAGVAAPAVAVADGHEHEHPHDHAHPHEHPHPHEAAPAGAGPDRAGTVARLRAGGQAIVAQLDALTSEDLRIVPPASPFADGTSPLDRVLRGLAEHLQEHLECMRRAISAVHQG